MQTKFRKYEKPGAKQQLVCRLWTMDWHLCQLHWCRRRVQARPQKFLFGENPVKIRGNLGKISENLHKIPENLSKLPENVSKKAPNML